MTTLLEDFSNTLATPNATKINHDIIKMIGVMLFVFRVVMRLISNILCHIIKDLFFE